MPSHDEASAKVVDARIDQILPLHFSYITPETRLLNVGGRYPTRTGHIHVVSVAYENLSNRKAKPEDAPSLGVWSLLQWGRQYHNRFFEMVLPKAMAAQPPEDEQNQRRERRGIAEIEGVLHQMEQQWEQELIANAPETVKASVRGIVGDWSRRFGAALPDGASTNLEAHIADLVDHCGPSRP